MTGQELFARMSRLDARDFVFRDEDPLKDAKRESYVRLDALYDLFRDIDAPPEPHKPGDFHEYRTECRICGQPGSLYVELRPQPRWHPPTRENPDE